MKFKLLLLAGMAGSLLGGCDSILAPEGAPAPPPDAPAPPPLDIDYEDDVADDPFASPEYDEIPPHSKDELGPMDEQSSIELPPAGTDLENAAIITNLAAINATPCAAATTQKTETIAQVANATTPVSRIDDSLSSRVIQPSVVNPVGSALALTALRADYPGIVKLEPKKQLSETSASSGHCGATRIASNWFVTAAHCLDEEYDRTILKVGHEKLDGPVVEEITAGWSACHAAYSGQQGGLDNDIALVHVSEDQLSKLNTVPIANIVSNDQSLSPLTHPTGKMAGWGLTAPGGSLSNTLLGTNVEVKSIGPALIKVNSIDGKGPCIGDSGGPLFLSGDFGNPVLLGVLSGVEKASGQACTGDYTARYTNLQGYTNWINSVINACTTNPTLCVAQSDAS